MTPTTTSRPLRTAIVARELTKIYGTAANTVRALDGVDVEIATGQLTAIVGASGSGKSTLMHCLAGLDTPTSGRIFLGETEITGMTDRDLTLTRRRRVGFIFQAFNLLPMLTAEQNITLPLRLAGKRVDREWFNHIVGVLGISDRLVHRPSELSGGQQQRVAVARALVSRPSVIFADEPTGALDSASSTDLLEFMRDSVQQLGQTIVMVTHDPRVASYADSVLTMSDGRIIEVNTR